MKMGISMSPTLERRRTAIKNAQPRSIAAMRPDLLGEWDWEKNDEIGLDPTVATTGSHTKASWLCEEHGSYLMAISNRIQNGYGCQKCGRERTRLARIKPKEGQALGDLYPELAKEWDSELNGSLTPYDVKPGSGKKVFWRHMGTHVWEAVIYSRVKGRGCPYCAGKRLLSGYNDLETIAPEIAAEWHPTLNGDRRPSEITAMNNEKVWWLGKCGHKWMATPNARVSAHTGCPHCYSGRQVSFSEKSLYYYIKQLFPDAEENAHPGIDGLGRYELDIWVPSLMTAVEYDGYYWHNKNPQRDTDKDAVCKACGIRLIRVRENQCVDYPDSSATIIKKTGVYGYNYQDEAVVLALKELCPNGYEQISVNVERDREEIAGLITLKEVEGSLVSTHEQIAAEWHPELNGEFKPSMFTYGSGFRAWWICPKGHEPYQTIISVRTRGCGCPKCKAENCSKRRLTPRPGCSIAEKFPDLAKEWNYEKNGDLTPSDVSYGSRTILVNWVCPEGHEYAMLPNRRTSGKGGGCPTCREIAERIAREQKREWRLLPVGGQMQLSFAS